MTQLQYQLIVECIKYGSPAFANDLIKAFDTVVACSNEYLKEHAATDDKAVTNEDKKEKE